MTNLSGTAFSEVPQDEAEWARTAAGVLDVIPFAALAAADFGRPAPPSPIAIGTIDRDLVIDHVSHDAEVILGVAADVLVGTPLVALVAPHDVARCTSELRGATTGRCDVSVRIALRHRAKGEHQQCDLRVLPLHPLTTCVFVFSGVHGASRVDPAATHRVGLHGSGRGAEVANVVRGLPGNPSSRGLLGLGRLTTRELEVTKHLLEGRRPPAIAATLFVSQSTVRNHLAAVFSKFGVTSQQGLLDALRTDEAPRGASGAGGA